LNYSNYNSW